MAEALKITSMGVRRHLITLERDGLIQYRIEPRGAGRPRYLYSLTERGDEIFPRTYPQLANSLIENVRAIYGEAGVERLFDQRTEELAKQYKTRMVGKDLAGRVAELAKIREEEGYMADWEQRDAKSFVLREHNCAICQVAKRCPAACRHELELFQRVLPEAGVTRERHIIKGDPMCAYLIRVKDGERALRSARPAARKPQFKL